MCSDIKVIIRQVEARVIADDVKASRARSDTGKLLDLDVARALLGQEDCVVCTIRMIRVECDYELACRGVPP